ncbi:MAG: hypothetical protein H0U86_06200 [Chloroflexi bacterium]|nr:hypothetical protein [Chloroflexota bacterium]
MTVDGLRRPTSAAGLDGVASIVIERNAPDLTERLAADDALGRPQSSSQSVTGDDPEERPVRALEVTAAAPADAGPFDGIVGALLGFLFG